MMDIPVKNPVFPYGDNQSLLWNTVVPDSTVKKKSSAVDYHFVREGVAKKEWVTGYINTSENCSDLIKKTVSSGQDRSRNIRQLIYDIYTEDNVSNVLVTFCHKHKRSDTKWAQFVIERSI